MLEALIRIELLGQLRILHGDRIITRFRTYKTGVLLAYLAFYGGRSHPREELIELLWTDCDPVLGRNSLSQSLSSLRRQLEPPGTTSGTVLIADRATVQLNAQCYATDVEEFEAACLAFRTADLETDRSRTFNTVEKLYCGDLL